MNPGDVERVVTAARQELGKVTRVYLGEITAHLIQRFAITIGETNPLYFDPDYARQLGYENIVAPPTLVTSILVWEPGPPEDRLRVDGTVADPIVPVQGFRRMGGGQRLQFISPVVAGDRLVMERALVDVAVKEGRTGTLIFLVTEKKYLTTEERLRVVCTETVIVR